MPDEKKIPEGRLGRLVRMASVGARTGASLLLSKDGASAAEQAAEVLGTLRGLAAKVGQMASYVDGMVPEDHRDAYEASMKRLRAAAPTSSPAAIRAVVEEDLGAPIDRLFAAWDDAPLASASIGQVHRAELHDGAVVAVKVQHPGIARAIDSDLENAGIIESMVGAIGPKGIKSKEIFDEIAKRFREELDYELEAERQKRFIRLHAGDPKIHIPRVVDDRSSRRVLTTELATGRTLEDAALAPEHARRAHAETLWRFVFKGNLVGGMFNADPHPGNYIFHDDGRITFLDFGCCQPIEGDRLHHARALHQAALRRDEAAFKACAAIILETRGGLYEEMAIAYSRRCFEPIFASPHAITRSYVASLVADIKDMKQVMFRKDGNFVQLPSGMIFMNRLQFGFYSVLARLDVEVDYARVERAFLIDAGITDESAALTA